MSARPAAGGWQGSRLLPASAQAGGWRRANWRLQATTTQASTAARTNPRHRRGLPKRYELPRAVQEYVPLQQRLQLLAVPLRLPPPLLAAATLAAWSIVGSQGEPVLCRQHLKHARIGRGGGSGTGGGGAGGRAGAGRVCVCQRPSAGRVRDGAA